MGAVPPSSHEVRFWETGNDRTRFRPYIKCHVEPCAAIRTGGRAITIAEGIRVELTPKNADRFGPIAASARQGNAWVIAPHFSQAGGGAARLVRVFHISTGRPLTTTGNRYRNI